MRTIYRGSRRHDVSHRLSEGSELVALFEGGFTILGQFQFRKRTEELFRLAGPVFSFGRSTALCLADSSIFLAKTFHIGSSLEVPSIFFANVERRLRVASECGTAEQAKNLSSIAVCYVFTEVDLV